jgi:protein-L-isoaspartate(D-aspartate) O-methyltransferase
MGGRLVMPVGTTARAQQLVRVVRTGEAAYEREELGEVAFVPLIGAEGWPEGDGRRRPAARPEVDHG